MGIGRRTYARHGDTDDAVQLLHSASGEGPVVREHCSALAEGLWEDVKEGGGFHAGAAHVSQAKGCIEWTEEDAGSNNTLGESHFEQEEVLQRGTEEAGISYQCHVETNGGGGGGEKVGMLNPNMNAKALDTSERASSSVSAAQQRGLKLDIDGGARARECEGMRSPSASTVEQRGTAQSTGGGEGVRGDQARRSPSVSAVEPSMCAASSMYVCGREGGRSWEEDGEGMLGIDEK